MNYYKTILKSMLHKVLIPLNEENDTKDFLKFADEFQRDNSYNKNLGNAQRELKEVERIREKISNKEYNGNPSELKNEYFNALYNFFDAAKQIPVFIKYSKNGKYVDNYEKKITVVAFPNKMNEVYFKTFYAKTPNAIEGFKDFLLGNWEYINVDRDDLTFKQTDAVPPIGGRKTALKFEDIENIQFEKLENFNKRMGIVITVSKILR